MNEIDQLKEKIKELEEQLQMEKMVKKSEVMLNTELKEQVEKLYLQVESILKINDEYAKKIVDLRIKIKKLI
jgi:hypothetical protein